MEKLYVIMPSEIQYNLDSRKETSSITSRMNEDSFEDEKIYTNTAQLKITSDFTNKYKIVGIYKDTADNYYEVATTNFSDFVLDKGVFEVDLLEFIIKGHVVEDENGVPHMEYYYDDENSVYENCLDTINVSECQMVEVPLS